MLPDYLADDKPSNWCSNKFIALDMIGLWDYYVVFFSSKFDIFHFSVLYEIYSQYSAMHLLESFQDDKAFIMC